MLVPLNLAFTMEYTDNEMYDVMPATSFLLLLNLPQRLRVPLDTNPVPNVSSVKVWQTTTTSV